MIPPNNKQAKWSETGFSLMELLVVLLIVGVLMAILFPTVQKVRSKMDEAGCISNLRQMATAANSYMAEHNGLWPPNRTGGPVFSNALIPYLGESVPVKGDPRFKKSVFVCPGDKGVPGAPENNYNHQGLYTPASFTDPVTNKTGKYAISYAQNVYATVGDRTSSNQTFNRNEVELASKMMLFMDFRGHYITSLARFNDEALVEDLNGRHQGRWNAAFVDGSVRPILHSDVPLKTSDLPHPFFQGRTKN